MLLDTSGLFCHLDAGDARHADAVAFVESAPRLVTHNYVLAELIPLCESRGIDRALTIAYATKIGQNPDVEIIWVDEHLHAGGLAFLRARADKAYSLCDAVSFVLMRERGIIEALTTDRHFEQEGFVRLLPP